MNENEFDELPTESDGRTVEPAPEAEPLPEAPAAEAEPLPDAPPAEAEPLPDAPPAEAEPAAEEQVAPRERLHSIIESLLFAADKPLTPAQIKQLVGERETDVVTQALEDLKTQYAERGVQIGEVAGGWQLRTAPENAHWVQKLLGGRPVRLTRAQLETLSIIAYRQPITRPEIDEIRGVDSGATLKLLLDRSLIRILGKKEEPGRPLLYGTTKEFLEFFNLKDLRDLPTLREFHELTEEHRAKVEALEEELPPPEAATSERPTAQDLPALDPAEEEALLTDLAAAEQAAESASAPFKKPKEQAPPEGGVPPPATTE